MGPLVTPEELAQWMQIPQDDLPSGAEFLLEVASDVARDLANSSFTRRESTVRLWVRSGGSVPVPLRPLIGISEVLDDATGAEIPYREDQGRIVVQPWRHRVRVTAEHGYSEPPGVVRAVILQAVDRAIQNPGNIRQESVGSISRTYATEMVSGAMSEADRDVLRGYRRQSGTVMLR